MKEVQLWGFFILKNIPGFVGVSLRRLILPSTKGSGLCIWDNVQLNKPSLISFGNSVSINRGTIIHGGGGVVIGSNVLIAPNVIIYSQNHEFSDLKVPINSQGYSYSKVIIADDVWIAAGVIILPGVFIGEGSVIGAGSVVTNNIPKNSLAVGVPAKVVKSNVRI